MEKKFTLADVEEMEKIPFTQRMNVTNTYDLIVQGAALNPDGPAITFIPSGKQYDRSVIISYREFVANINRTANFFYSLGIGPKDVISFLLPNLPHSHYALWGGEAAGITNPLNPMLDAATLCEICRFVKTKVIVALGPVKGNSSIWEKVMAIRKELPDLRAIVSVMGPSLEAEGIYSFEEHIGRFNGKSLDSERQFSSDDVASYYLTGGTTGMPKISPRTHLNEVAVAVQQRLTMDLAPGEAQLGGLPLFHVHGTGFSGFIAFSMGANVVILSPGGYRDPEIMKNIFKIIELYRPVSFPAVPTLLSGILNIPRQGEDISSVRTVICGAAPLSRELGTRWEAETGIKVVEGYGMTESTGVSSANPTHGIRKWGSIGLRRPYQEMRVFMLDEEGRHVREAETDEVGSICIKGPNVFKGYLDPRQNRNIWPKEGWFNTGDLGRQDADGYFWLTGRQKDLIIRGGHNIDPAVIEEPLLRLKGVKSAAAVGRPDAYAGELPIVYVELESGSDLLPEGISEYLQKSINEPAAVPKEVIVIPSMPLTPIGKIFKPALRRDAMKRVCEQQLRGLRDLVLTMEIEIREDKVYGTLAVLRITPTENSFLGDIEDRIAQALGAFTFKYRVEVKK